MSDIVLSREGIFPLKDAATGFHIAGTIQGEGKYAGEPSIFIRTQGCNLRCIWSGEDGRPQICDTSHTSFYAFGGIKMSVEEILAIINQNRGEIHHVVLTGGEPLLQGNEAAQLLRLLRESGFVTTLETNGTIFCREAIEQSSLVSISPKLRSSNPTKEKLCMLGLSENEMTRHHAEKALNIITLQDIIDCARENGNDVQLKFVIATMNDEEEIANIVSQLHGISGEDVLLMPMGVTHEALQQNGLIATQIAIKNGWRFSPRLHIELFGNKEGV